MPTSPRRNDWSSSSAFNSTYPPTPPAQLPTPLPEERLPVMDYMVSPIESSLIGESESDAGGGPQLIDFDTLTPPRPFLPLDSDNINDERFVDEDHMALNRTPPFREAQLPKDSPPPLPVRPRVSPSIVTLDEDDTHTPDHTHSIGRRRFPHISRPTPRTASATISPTFSNSGSSSTIENLTRTIRGYVPSIPSPVSSPTATRPLTFFGNSPGPARPFSQDHRRTVSQQEFERDYELHDSDESQYYGFDGRLRAHASQDASFDPYTPPREGRSAQISGASGLAQAMQRSGHVQQQSSDQVDAIIWARFDILHDQRLLFLGYTSRLQVWDCTRLSSVDEVLNLNFDSEEWRTFFGSGLQGVHVVHAAILPASDMPNDPYTKQRPFIGFLLQVGYEDTLMQGLESMFLVYSVQHVHHIVKSLSFSGSPSTFVANEHFIVICTTNPPSLYILSPTTFHTLHTISSTSFELFVPQVSFSNTTTPSTESTIINKPVSSSFFPSLDTMLPSDANYASRKLPQPLPIFALSHRLLAYASPMPSSQNVLQGKESRRLSSSSSISVPSGTSVSSSPFGLPSLGRITNMTQADVGNAALKAGETVFSGLKYLGGIALEAAKSRMIPGSSAEVTISQDTGDLTADSRERFVSRSAPDHRAGVENNSPVPRERRYSSSASPDDSQLHSTAVVPLRKPVVGTRYYVTVVDLLPLLQLGKDGHPVKIDEFVVSHTQSVSKIEFSADGTCVGIAFRDGHSFKVFKLQPSPRASPSVFLRSDRDEGTNSENQKTDPTLIYKLRRGITPGVVERVEWAKDGRYVGICTRNRTVHIYAVNPYGGKADVRSHLEGRVRNIETMEVPLTHLIPIVRLKGARTLSPGQVKAALTFAFISSAELTASPGLLPPLSPVSAPHSATLSPISGKRGTNYQHVLLFDPNDGVLSLYRLTLEKHVAKEPVMASVAASAQALSISFPGMGGGGNLTLSPTIKHGHTGKSIEPDMELGAKSYLVATYDLKLGMNWIPVSKPLGISEDKKGLNSVNRDYLAEAELSTCSNSDRVLPRSIYLSHQFTFHTLGEDYHALIRSYQFNISGSKMEVRKEVEINAYPMRNNATFVDAFPSRDIIHGPSSIDEPIASAISGSFESFNIPPILPMYPNGVPGTSMKSLRNSIPIRAMSGIGEGVTEGFGRIRREMHRVRSPHRSARRDSVPLEFDEEDEDLVDREMKGSYDANESLREGNRSDSRSFVPVETTTHKLLDGDVVGTVDEDLFDGWDMDDKQAIEEAEEFADLNKAGLAEEERRQYQPSQGKR